MTHPLFYNQDDRDFATDCCPFPEPLREYVNYIESSPKLDLERIAQPILSLL